MARPRANPNLPQEILLEIFTKLPAKSVGRCITLSKSWKSQLSTSNFIKNHLIYRKQTKTHQENLILITKAFKLCIINSPTKSDEVFNDTSFPDKKSYVFGSCNGLLYLNWDKKLLLVNPVTRKEVVIKPLKFAKRHELGDLNSTVCEFGYDSCSDDYKLVQICTYPSKNVGEHGLRVVHVYSVKNSVWKSVVTDNTYDGFVWGEFPFRCGALVNEALHWLIYSKGGYRSCIAVFDLASEVFREIPLPNGFVKLLGHEADGVDTPRRTTLVSVVGGCLSIIDNFGNGTTDVWIMNEYGAAKSWVKFRIKAEDDIYKWDSIVATLCYVEDGVLLCLTSGNHLFACDLKGGTVRRVVLGGRDDALYDHGMVFDESLVSLD